MDSQAYQVAGWDIGGAHVKLAFVDNDELVVKQWDCPLWKGLDELVNLLGKTIDKIPEHINNHRVTMTGELVDIFESHDDGVEKIIRTFTDQVSSRDNVSFFSSNGLLTAQEALENKLEVASANWIASAQLVSESMKNVVFVDIGSTTTDILHIDDQGLVLKGLTDFDRLVTGELVYTGVVRSCVNTLCRKIPYKDMMVPLMAEYFSTSADIYRILDWLPGHADYGQTMDGGPKDKISSMTRLARMIGKDYSPEDESLWVNASEYIAQKQIQMIEKSVISIINCNSNVSSIVGAGVGVFLIKVIAEKLTLDYHDFSGLVVPEGIQFTEQASDCAPAVALVFMKPNDN